MKDAPGISQRTTDIKRGIKNRYQVHVYYPELGKSVQYTIHGSLADAKRFKKRKEAEKIRGVTLANVSRITVREYLLDWLPLRSGSIKRRTYEEYARIIRRDLIPAFGHVQLSQLKGRDLERYYNSLHESGKSVNTILRKHFLLSGALEDALRDDYVSVNICRKVHLPAPDDIEASILSMEGCRTFLDMIRHDTLYYPIAYTLLFTGMRLNECLGLSWANIDFQCGEHGMIKVTRSLTKYRDEYGKPVFDTPKSKTSKRPLYLPESLSLLLRRHREWQQATYDDQRLTWDDRALVFTKLEGAPHRGDTVGKRIKRYLCKCGHGECNVHSLRHTHISILYNDGQPGFAISKHAGHTKEAFTREWYGHEFQETSEKLAGRFDTIMADAGVALAKL